jgi:hypothetical protein
MIATTAPNHTAGGRDAENPGTEASAAREGERPKYNSYKHYLRETEGKPYLSEQREILGSILFDTEGHRLMKGLAPAAFSQRSYADFNDEKGTLEWLAEAAFIYWEKHGQPPGEDIYDLIADLPERVLWVARSMEREQRKLDAEDAHERARYERILSRHNDDDDFEPYSRASHWVQMLASIEEYCEELKPRASVRQRVSRSEKRKTRRQQVEAMLGAGKPRREIMEATGLTAGRISQIAGEEKV